MSDEDVERIGDNFVEFVNEEKSQVTILQGYSTASQKRTQDTSQTIHSQSSSRFSTFSQISQDGKRYYQRVFSKILEHLQSHFKPILSEQELNLLSILGSLPDGPQRLFIRLFQRKGDWLRQNKLKYDDIDIDSAVSQISDASLLEIYGSTDDDLFRMEYLSVEELKSIAEELRLAKYKTLNRDQLINCILRGPARLCQNVLCTDKNIFGLKKITVSRSSLIAEKCGPMVRLCPERVNLLTGMINGLFFLNTSLDAEYVQDFSTAILADLERAKYPTYIMSDPMQVFPTRADWLAFENAKRIEVWAIGRISGEKPITKPPANVNTSSLGLLPSSNIVDMFDEQPTAAAAVLTVYRKLFKQFKHYCQDEQNAVEERSVFLRRYTPGWVLCRCLGGFILDGLEKDGYKHEAHELLRFLLSQDTYCPGRRGKWWDRLALMLQKYFKNAQRAKEACQYGLADEHVRTAARYALEHRLKSIEETLAKHATQQNNTPKGKRKRHPATSLAKHHSEPPVVRLQAGQLTDAKRVLFGPRKLSVEQYVLEHFEENEGWSGLHSESSVWTTIFACLFWDILFGVAKEADRGVLPQPFLTAPLDLSTDAFYEDRKGDIESILYRIDVDIKLVWVKSKITNCFRDHFGEQVMGLSWSIPSESLYAIVECTGSKPLARIMRELAEDYRNACAGMPDLVLWKLPAHKNYEENVNIDGVAGEFMMVEVKSVKDHLSHAQRFWYSVFEGVGVKMIVARLSDHRKTTAS